MTSPVLPMREIIGQAMYDDMRGFYEGILRDDCLVTADIIISKLGQLAYTFQEYCYARGGAEWLAVDPKEFWQGFLLVCEHGGPFNASPTDGCYDMEQEPCPLCIGKCGRE